MDAEKRKYPTSELEVLENGVREVVEPSGLKLALKPVPGDDREHVLDPRVYARAHAKLAAVASAPAAAASASGGPIDVIAWRSAPNKETHVVRGANVAKKTVVMNFGDRGIPLHVFTPEGHEAGSAALVFIHGGGFMVGNIGQYENCLRDIAERTGCVAIYPEYRLSPETMFPGGVEDCLKTVDWLVEHADELGVDATRIAVAGDSAGGSLTNAVVLDGSYAERIKLVVELYPLVDGGTIPDEWSYDLYEVIDEQRPEALSRVDRIRLANNDLPPMYTNGDMGEMLDPRISALFAEDVSVYPRTVIVSSEFDFLRYQDELFAKKLQDAGVDVTTIRYCGCDHGFFEAYGVMPQAEDVCRVISEELAKI